MITREEMNAVGQSGLQLYELSEKALSAEAWREALAEKTRELNAAAAKIRELEREIMEDRLAMCVKKAAESGWVQKETYDALQEQLVKSDHEVDVQKEIIADKDAVIQNLSKQNDLQNVDLVAYSGIITELAKALRLPLMEISLSEIVLTVKSLVEWQTEVLAIRTGWEVVDSYIRNHPDAIVGDYVHETCLKWLKERDEAKAALLGK